MKNRKLTDSFKNAYNGLKLAMVQERNMRIHIIAAILSLLLGIIFQLDVLRWALLLTAIALVIITELINTCLENMVDMITQEYSEKAKKIKDMAAGAVLITSFAAALMGILIFIEPLLNLLK